MFNLSQFRKLIIVPTLSQLQMYSTDAEELLVFTAAAESLGGTYLAQVKGPALGVYQMEPNTYTDIWENFIKYRHAIGSIMALNFDCSRIPDPNRLVYDLKFATAMARIHYARVKDALPKADDIESIWEYYKEHFNTPLGKSKKDKCIANYNAWLKS